MAREIPPLLVLDRRICHHSLQTIGGYTEQNYGSAITVVSMHPTIDTPVQSVHYIKAWPRFIHCRLAIPKQSQRKQRPGN